MGSSLKTRVKNRDLLAELKVQMGCTDCGYNASPFALEFDHVRGEKANTIGQMYAFGERKIVEELAKCEVRCANCHSLRTAERRG